MSSIDDASVTAIDHKRKADDEPAPAKQQLPKDKVLPELTDEQKDHWTYAMWQRMEDLRVAMLPGGDQHGLVRRIMKKVTSDEERAFIQLAVPGSDHLWLEIPEDPDYVDPVRMNLVWTKGLDLSIAMYYKTFVVDKKFSITVTDTTDNARTMYTTWCAVLDTGLPVILAERPPNAPTTGTKRQRIDEAPGDFDVSRLHGCIESVYAMTKTMRQPACACACDAPETLPISPDM